MTTLSSMLGDKFVTHRHQPQMPAVGECQRAAARRVATLPTLLRAFEEMASQNSESIANNAPRTAALMPTVSARQIWALPVPKGDTITAFHSVRVSRLSLTGLVQVLSQNFDSSAEFMIVAVVIMVRYCETSGFRPTLHSMHRLLAASVCLAIKTHCDAFYANIDAGVACGLCVEEVNRLELALCTGMNWHLLVTATEIDDCKSLLQRISRLRRQPPTETAGSPRGIDLSHSLSPLAASGHEYVPEADRSSAVHSMNAAMDDVPVVDLLDRGMSPRSISPSAAAFA